MSESESELQALREGIDKGRGLYGHRYYGIEISDENFDEANMTGVGFEDTTFTNCSFVKADLCQLDLRGNTTFKSCNFDGANFEGSEMERDKDGIIKFINCSMIEVSMDNVEASGFGMIGCNLVGSSFHLAKFKDFKFARCLMERTIWTRAALNGMEAQKKGGFLKCDLQGANFTGAKMHNLTLDKVDFTGTRTPNLSDVENVQIGMIIIRPYMKEVSCVPGSAAISTFKTLKPSGRVIALGPAGHGGEYYPQGGWNGHLGYHNNPHHSNYRAPEPPDKKAHLYSNYDFDNLGVNNGQ